MDEVEEWRAVPFGIGCEVSSLGRFRSRWEFGGADPTPRVGTKWKILRGSPHKFGYTMYYVRTASGVERWCIHRLVAVVFIGEPPFPKAEARHWDGNPRNNKTSNILWGTHKENHQDRIRHGTTYRGENCPTTTLKNWQVLEIVRLWSSGMLRKDLVKQYNVSPMTISRIVNGRMWSYVTGLKPTTCNYK